MRLFNVLLMLLAALVAAPVWAVNIGHPAHPDTAVPLFQPADGYPKSSPPAAAATSPAHAEHAATQDTLAAPTAGDELGRPGNGCFCCLKHCGHATQEELPSKSSCSMMMRERQAQPAADKESDHALHY